MTFFCNLLFTWVCVPSQMTWAQMSRLSICILYVVYRLSIYISCVSIYIFARPNGSMDMQHDLCANESLMQIFKSSIHIYKFRMDVCVFKMVCVRMYVSTVMYQDVRWMYIIDRRLGSRYKTCFQMCVSTHICIYTYMQQSKRHVRKRFMVIGHYIYVCIYWCIRACIYTCINIHIANACMLVDIYIYIHTDIYRYVYMWVG